MNMFYISNINVVLQVSDRLFTVAGHLVCSQRFSDFSVLFPNDIDIDSSSTPVSYHSLFTADSRPMSLPEAICQRRPEFRVVAVARAMAVYTVVTVIYTVQELLIRWSFR